MRVVPCEPRRMPRETLARNCRARPRGTALTPHSEIPVVAIPMGSSIRSSRSEQSAFHPTSAPGGMNDPRLPHPIQHETLSR